MLKNMKPTAKVLSLDGRPWCRVWEAETEGGHQVEVLVQRVQVPVDSPANEELLKALEEVQPPEEIIQRFEPGSIWDACVEVPDADLVVCMSDECERFRD